MKYQLIENYFETELFQNVVREYFDTVLAKLIGRHTTTSAKGLFIVDGKQWADYYDMPYHVHILTGLIPALFLYEKYMQERGYDSDNEADLYLRVFILGFSFHDSNKLLHAQQTSDRSDLEVGVSQLDEHVAELAVYEFLHSFDQHKSNVYYLALAAEDGSWVASEDYPITLNRDEIVGVQRKLAHLADGIASIQNENLESIERLHDSISRKLRGIQAIVPMSVSFIKVRHNPYTLLSQNLLQVARKVLLKNGKKVILALREGFVFWGEPVTEAEYAAIEKEYEQGSVEDIKFVELTNVDAQRCTFGFIGSAPFTYEVLDEVTDVMKNRFLALSPNTPAKIEDFDAFVTFSKQLVAAYGLPLECKDDNGRLLINYFETFDDGEDELFMKVYNLHKIQWLNTKENSEWNKDFKKWTEEQRELPKIIVLKDTGEEVSTIPALLQFISDKVNSTNALYKTYLNFIKTWLAIREQDDVDEYLEDLQNSIINHFESQEKKDSVKQQIFLKYFECPGHVNLQFLNDYSPEVPIKKEMCAFTGTAGTVPYKAVVAFGMKARGFSNRTVTSLSNKTSHISSLFAEENKLRASMFSTGDANLMIYHDFFEARLDIDRDIVTSCVKAKDELSVLEDGVIQFDKNAKFHYNLYNLDFIQLAPKVEPTFFLVRKCLRLVQHMGLRTYISGIMTPYTPHRAVFHFDNAPRFLKLLEWDSIRLIHVEEVLDEMYLVLRFGKDRIESNLLKIAQSRSAYFKLYYLLGDEDQNKIFDSLQKFYKKYPQKFKGMTVTEQLVKLAIKIDVGFRSGAEETWMIRTAMEYLRKYHKQGSTREDIIQKICGEIYRKLRLQKHDNMEVIKDFATAVYDDLFIKDWKGSIPPVNVEKDWIYQFAFLFKEHSLSFMRENTARKVYQQLVDKDQEVNEENVKSLLSKNSQKYVHEYMNLISNLKN
ncbi:hypothetical protein [Fulvivirga sediminis]|uniref:Uncharacterized protein n=1 Tax=Fulvivirga sediminis TaxID=2803949 RepID=A0A937F598_9BACT|nr:hypothetical protein [Fulvivirga sediminis]MBL3656672.1 hypothetical protein [Fulvivirga sediminis]